MTNASTQKNYKYKIDKLVYAAMYTRSNIVFAIERFNQNFNDSITHYKQTLMTLLRYIRFIIDLDIICEMKLNINKSLNSNESLNFKTFLNSDYVIDRFIEKSIFEYVYIFVKESII